MEKKLLLVDAPPILLKPREVLKYLDLMISANAEKLLIYCIALVFVYCSHINCDYKS